MMQLFSAHLKAQMVELWRSPSYWVPTLLFPAMLYSFFGAGFPANSAVAALVMASFTVYAVIGVAFYQFGVGIAQDRESPWEDYLRTLPAGPLPRIAGRIVNAALFAVAAAALVVLTALFMTAPKVSYPGLLLLALVCLLASPPFALLGVALGYWTNAKAAVAVANLIYLPMAYLGGLWLPPHRLPAAVQPLSEVMPTRHFGELAWSAVAGTPLPISSVLWLAAYTAIFGALALWGYRSNERDRYR